LPSFPSISILVLGGTGATGRLLVSKLLNDGHDVTVIVRTPSRLPEMIINHQHLTIVQGTVLEMTDKELADTLGHCDAVVSCLGHTISFRGIFGSPRKLVTGSVRRVTDTIKAIEPSKPIQLILMSSTGCKNTDANEPTSIAQRLVILLLKLLLPPHADNETAHACLRSEIGPNNPHVEWVIVRPDSLVDQDEVTPYDICPSPIRSAIFDAGKSSRMNVADFMAILLSDPNVWTKWAGQMPVLYNKTE